MAHMYLSPAERRDEIARLEKLASTIDDKDAAIAYRDLAANRRAELEHDEQIAKAAKPSSLLRESLVPFVDGMLEKTASMNRRLDAVESRATGRPTGTPRVMPTASAPMVLSDSERAVLYRNLAKTVSDHETRQAYLDKAAESEGKALAAAIDPKAKGSAIEIATRIELHLTKASGLEESAKNAPTAIETSALMRMAQAERAAATALRKSIDKGAK